MSKIKDDWSEFMRDGRDFISASVGAIAVGTFSLAYIWSNHETITLAFGAIIVSLLIPIVFFLRHRSSKREEEWIKKTTNDIEMRMSAQYNWISMRFASGIWNENDNTLTIQVKLFTAYPKPIELLSSNIESDHRLPICLSILLNREWKSLPIHDGLTSIFVNTHKTGEENFHFFAVSNYTIPYDILSMNTLPLEVQAKLLVSDRKVECYKETINIVRRNNRP